MDLETELLVGSQIFLRVLDYSRHISWQGPLSFKDWGIRKEHIRIAARKLAFNQSDDLVGRPSQVCVSKCVLPVT